MQIGQSRKGFREKIYTCHKGNSEASIPKIFTEEVKQMIRHTGRGAGVVAMGSCETCSGREREQMNTNNNECLGLESFFSAAPCQLFFLDYLMEFSHKSFRVDFIPILIKRKLRQTKVILLPHRYMLVSGRAGSWTPEPWLLLSSESCCSLGNIEWLDGVKGPVCFLKVWWEMISLLSGE